MIIIKPGNYQPELEGTCTRCGQVEGLEQSECGVFAGIFHKSCSLCGCSLKIEKKSKSELIDRPKVDLVEASRKLEERLKDQEPIDRPSADEIWEQIIEARRSWIRVGDHLLKTFDIRRKK